MERLNSNDLYNLLRMKKSKSPNKIYNKTKITNDLSSLPANGATYEQYSKLMGHLET